MVYQSGKYGEAKPIDVTKEEAIDTAKQLEQIDPKLSVAYKKYASTIREPTGPEPNISLYVPDQSSGYTQGYAYAPDSTTMSKLPSNISLVSGREGYAYAPTTLMSYEKTDKLKALSTAQKQSNTTISKVIQEQTPPTKKYSGLDIQAAPKRTFLGKTKGFFTDFGTGLKEGYTLKYGALQEAKAQTTTKGTGVLFGTLGAIATVGAAPKVQGVTRGFYGTKVGQTISTFSKKPFIDFTLTTGKALAIGEGSKIVGQKIQERELTEIQKAQLQRVDVNKLIGVGRTAQKEAVTGGSTFNIPFTQRSLSPKGVLFDITTIGAPKEPFRKAVQQELLQQGKTQREAQQITRSLEVSAKGRERGEVAGLIGISGVVEGFGRRQISRQFAKTSIVPKTKITSTVLKKTVPSLFAAGVIEGSTQEITQRRARGQEVDAKSVAVIGGLGGVSAGLIGGTIAGLSASGRGFTSKAVETTANIFDPYEKAGDLFADVSENVGRGFTNVKPVTPVLTFTPSGQAKTTVQVPKKRVKAPSIVKESIFVPAQQITPTVTTKAIKPSFRFVTPTIGKPITSPFTIGKPKEPTIIPTIQQTPKIVPTVPTPLNVFTPPKPKVPVPTITKTPTPSIKLPTIKIPTVTPQFRIPPPLPLALNLGGGAGGGRGKKGVKYISEIEQARKLRKKLLGGLF